MMSETSARASRFARWLGSLERNGFTGRRAPASATDGEAPGGVIIIGFGGCAADGGALDAAVTGGAPGGIGGTAARGVGAGGGVGEVATAPDARPGLIGGAGGLFEEPGTNGGADGAPLAGCRGGTNGGGDEPNS